MKIAIASGKGGTGKTSLATNLAMLMAETGPVVLADLDVEEPDSSLFISFNEKESWPMFRMIPEWDAAKCTLCGHCQEVCNFNAVLQILDEIVISGELCHSCHACSDLCPENALPMKNKSMGCMRYGNAGNLDFIESRLDVGEEQAVPLIARTLEYLDENYSADDCILIDSPPGTSCPVIEIASDSDLIILVAEPTPFGLNDLKLSVETLRLLERDFVVVVNRFGMGDSRIGDYCRQEGIELIARIPYSRQAAECYASGELMIRTLPGIRREVEKINDHIKMRMEKRS